MTALARRVRRIYLILMLGNTLAGSFIWGINTLFLLDAGLSNLEAFTVNAFFTAGMMIFEVPTGVVADAWGRRASCLCGTITLAVATLLYWLMWRLHAPLVPWAIASMLLGLGFTFFSGATEAWLVDALHFAGEKGDLDAVLGEGQMIMGVAMLGGTVAGGFIAQLTNLGAPYLVRVGVLLVMFAVAATLMTDLGFVPDRTGPRAVLRSLVRASIEHGWKNRPVRWVMLATPFAAGAGMYAFYAAQPYLLALYGHTGSYAVAGLAAALIAGTQITGGWAAPRIRRLFERRTSALLVMAVLGALSLALLGVASTLPVAVACLCAWGMASAVETPIQQAYVNGMIPSKQRATLLSFESLLQSSGGVVLQPVLGKVADAHGYASSFVLAGLISLGALPFLLASRSEKSAADSRQIWGSRPNHPQ